MFDSSSYFYNSVNLPSSYSHHFVIILKIDLSFIDIFYES